MYIRTPQVCMYYCTCTVQGTEYNACESQKIKNENENEDGKERYRRVGVDNSVYILCTYSYDSVWSIEYVLYQMYIHTLYMHM